MRLLSVRLIVSLIVGITLVSLGFSYYEVVGEKRALRSELERRAEVLGESVAGNVEKSWETGSERGLQRLVQRFGNREHLLGVAVYDRQGKVMAITSELGQILTATPHGRDPGHQRRAAERVRSSDWAEIRCTFSLCLCIVRMKLWGGWPLCTMSVTFAHKAFASGATPF